MKQEFEPWNKEEREVMQISLDQTQLKIDTNESEILKFGLGIENIEKEVEANILTAKMNLKAAKISLAEIEYDKAHHITENRLFCKIAELKQENDRNKKNLKAFRIQLKEGKPKVEEQMSEEPKVEKTPEEKAKGEKEEKKEEVSQEETVDKKEDQAEPDKRPSPEEKATPESTPQNETGKAEEGN